MNITAMFNPEDVQRFNRNLAIYVHGFGLSAEEVVRKWSKVLVQDLIRMTPPMRQGKAKAGDTPRIMGTKAVIRDLKRAVEPIVYSKEEMRKYSYGNYFSWTTMDKFKNSKSIRKLLKAKDMDGMKSVMSNVSKLKNKELVKFTESLHTSARGKDYKVKNKSNKMTLDADEWKRYADKLIKSIGKLKASWLPAANLLQVQAVEWVKRHESYGQQVTNVEDKLSQPEHSIAIHNTSGGIGRMRDFIRIAARNISTRMEKDIKHKLNFIMNKGKT